MDGEEPNKSSKSVDSQHDSKVCYDNFFFYNNCY